MKQKWIEGVPNMTSTNSVNIFGRLLRAKNIICIVQIKVSMVFELGRYFHMHRNEL